MLQAPPRERYAFEEAARLRDEIRRLEGLELGLDKPGVSISAASAHGLEGAQKRNLDGSNSEKNLNIPRASNRSKSKRKKNKNKLINQKKKLLEENLMLIIINYVR